LQHKHYLEYCQHVIIEYSYNLGVGNCYIYASKKDNYLKCAVNFMSEYTKIESIFFTDICECRIYYELEIFVIFRIVMISQNKRAYFINTSIYERKV
jgi:hypothetical protein